MSKSKEIYCLPYSIAIIKVMSNHFAFTDIDECVEGAIECPNEQPDCVVFI